MRQITEQPHLPKQKNKLKHNFAYYILDCRLQKVKRSIFSLKLKGQNVPFNCIVYSLYTIFERNTVVFSSHMIGCFENQTCIMCHCDWLASFFPLEWMGFGSASLAKDYVFCMG